MQSKVISSLTFDNLMYKKRSRARVTIGGQSVVLQNSPKIKMFDIFVKLKLPHESHLSRHTSEPLKKL